jgi:hypothetical protein
MAISVQWVFWRMGRPVTGQVPIFISFLATFTSVMFYTIGNIYYHIRGKKSVKNSDNLFSFWLTGLNLP